MAAENSMIPPLEDGVDHVRGPVGTRAIVEYGDYECPYSRQAYREIQRVEAQLSEGVRFAFRHFPLTEIHPHALAASSAAEAAALQDRFWDMHDLLLDHQGALTLRDVIGYARSLGLDMDKFSTDLRKHAGAARIAEDVGSADLSGVSGTPTFFVNGTRHYGAYDVESLSRAVKLALARTKISAA